MSNELIRLTFTDGAELFTMGDGVDTITSRLWESEEEALNAYIAMKEAFRQNGTKDPLVVEYFTPIPSSLLAEAKQDAVEVEIEWQCGDEWKDCAKFYCKASKSHKLITEGPSYGPGDYA